MPATRSQNPPWAHEWRRAIPHVLPLSANLVGGHVSAGSGVFLIPPIYNLNTPVAANSINERGEYGGNGFGVDPYVYNTRSLWDYPFRMSVMLMGLSGGAGVPLMGMAMGSRGLPPFAASFEPFVGLQCRLDNFSWELVIARQGAAETIVPLVGVVPGAPLNATYWSRIELFYKPQDYVRAAVDGIIGAELTEAGSPGILPAAGDPPNFGGPGLFVMTSAGGSTDALFHRLEFSMYGTLNP